jgi:hypothetical protein
MIATPTAPARSETSERGCDHCLVLDSAYTVQGCVNAWLLCLLPSDACTLYL